MLVLLVSAGLLFLRPVNAATLTIVSDSGFVDASGGYYVFGEIQNREDQNIQCEKITATFYDSNNEKIAVKEMTFGFMYIIIPNQKSPFQIHLGDSDDNSQLGKKVDHYTLEVTAEYASAKPLAIDVVWTDNQLVLDLLTIEGEVKNLDTQVANNTMIFVTCYDKLGDVICADFGSIEKKQLAPGESSNFELTLIYPEVVDSIDSYKVNAFAYTQGSPGDLFTLLSPAVLFAVAIAVLVIAIVVGLTFRRKRKLEQSRVDNNPKPPS